MRATAKGGGAGRRRLDPRRRDQRAPRHRLAGGGPGAPVRHRRGRGLRRPRPRSHRQPLRPDRRPARLGARTRRADRRLFDSLETRVVAPGQGYGRLRTAFTDLLNDRWYALLVTTKYLGGATDLPRPPRRSRRATGGGQRPGRAAARGAGASSPRRGFGERAYRFPPELLSRLARGPLDALGRVTGRGRAARFPAARLGADAAGLAARPAARSRGAGADPRRRAPRRPRRDRPSGCRSCSPRLTGAIWSEIGAGGSRPRRCARATSSSVRRDLQRLLPQRADPDGA